MKKNTSTQLEQYHIIVQAFVIALINDTQHHIANNFLIHLDGQQQAQLDHAFKNPLQSPIGQTLADIARAAAGEMEDDEEGWNRGVTYEAIQSLMEMLFAPPGLGAAYDIPRRFWETDLGWMVLQAFMWTRQDKLLTATEAAERLGISLPAISQAVARGSLTGYRDPAENNPTKNLRLSEREVEAYGSK